MNIVIATHGKLCQGFLDSLRILLGEVEDIATVELNEQGIEHFKTHFNQVMTRIYQPEQGTLIFVDTFGGTPWNVAAGKIKAAYPHIEIIAGINLPLLLAAIDLRDSGISLSEVATELLSFASESIRIYKPVIVLNDDDE